MSQDRERAAYSSAREAKSREQQITAQHSRASDKPRGGGRQTTILYSSITAVVLPHRFSVKLLQALYSASPPLPAQVQAWAGPGCRPWASLPLRRRQARRPRHLRRQQPRRPSWSPEMRFEFFGFIQIRNFISHAEQKQQYKGTRGGRQDELDEMTRWHRTELVGK